MPKNNRYTKRQVIEALRSTAGLRSQAAAKLGCAPTTVTNYIERYPDIAEALRQIEEELIDFAEGKLISQIRSDNTAAVIFYLKTKGKTRGYFERSEVTGKDGGPIHTMATIDTSTISDEALAELMAARSNERST